MQVVHAWNKFFKEETVFTSSCLWWNRPDKFSVFCKFVNWCGSCGFLGLLQDPKVDTLVLHHMAHRVITCSNNKHRLTQRVHLSSLNCICTSLTHAFSFTLMIRGNDVRGEEGNSAGSSAVSWILENCGDFGGLEFVFTQMHSVQISSSAWL